MDDRNRSESGYYNRRQSQFRRRGIRTRKYCHFCEQKVKYVDYKNINLLQDYMNDRGKIVSGHSSGACSKHQRIIAQAIKRARILALLPFVEQF